VVTDILRIDDPYYGEYEIFVKDETVNLWWDNGGFEMPITTFRQMARHVMPEIQQLEDGLDDLAEALMELAGERKGS
jgi:hypothetical protein